MNDHLNETEQFLRAQLGRFPGDVAIIAGSGLGGLADALEQPLGIPYTSIPHFPAPSVSGHAGELVAGTCAGKNVLVCSGRVHAYEGRPPGELTYAVRTMHALGIKTLLVTNAAGGINPSFQPGDLMVMTDHINLLGLNPLVGLSSDPHHSPFVDLTDAYAPRLVEQLQLAASELNLTLQRGVYLATTGPSYETAAEIRALAALGADAVGMSTVPEVIMARYCGLEVAGLSCITNRAAGLGGEPLTHDEVLATGRATREKITRLVTAWIARL